MKTLEFKKFSIILFLAITQFAWVTGGQEATKVYKKLFPITAKASLEIDNRYGSVDIRNWEKDEISVEVKVKVIHSSRETADRQLTYININFSQHNNDIKAITEIDQRISRLGSRWFSSSEEKQGISIDYTVYAPKETDFKITHRYGDIFINEATGHTFIDLKYGNMQINKIIRDNTRPLSEINLAYSTKATITEADWLQLNLRYSDLSVNQCRALVISASYSKLRVDSASSIIAESRYGEFTLGHITNFITESAYTNYYINSVSKTLDVESRYGNVRVDTMPADFSKLRFVNSYGNMRIGIHPDASYNIEASASYGNINIPAAERVSRLVNGRQSTLSGIVGAEADPSARVEITTRYGNVDLTAR